MNLAGSGIQPARAGGPTSTGGTTSFRIANGASGLLRGAGRAVRRKSSA
jgi:hypothetical protein